MSQIVISSGHGKYIRGASDIIDEVDEARRVVNRTAEFLKSVGATVFVYHDDVSKTQDENLRRIVDFHNSKTRDLDVSVHFNAYEHTTKPMGTECLYVSQNLLAADVALMISEAGDFINRGAKKRTDLYFLNNTEEPAILIEVCFVDSTVDCTNYQRYFDSICAAIASAITGRDISVPVEPGEPTEPPVEPPSEALFSARGPCSWFGGPDDTGVDSDEGLAFLYNVADAPQLFLPFQPTGTTGLARRLNPWVPYVACRWDYDITPKEMLRSGQMALVRAHGLAMKAFPADWGPHEDTGRVADLSPGLMDALKLATDDVVEVVYPAADDLVA